MKMPNWVRKGALGSSTMKNSNGNVKLLVAGEQGMVVDFGNEISAEINERVQCLAQVLTELNIVGVTEIVPTYRSVMLYFDPILISRSEMAAIIEQCLLHSNGEIEDKPAKNIVRIPVCYGGVFGPDMDYVIRHTGLAENEVIQIHTSKPYLVYMLGFTPGFPYLGNLPEPLVVPRLSKLRTKIPEGSVGIAGSQTGFYTVQSAGGWRVIGRTPIKAFIPEAANPFMLVAGNYIQFESVTVDDFFSIREEVEDGRYTPKIVTLAEGKTA